MTIQWSQIEAECGNFRDGFVATFHKYEGQPTDEKDAQGRTVKVTMRSFALHAGITETTFKRWVKSAAREPLAPSDTVEQKDKRKARSMVRTQPDVVVDAIMEAPPEHQDKIYHELKLRRAGIDTSTSHRKATEARVDEIIEPIRKSFSAMGLAGMAEVIDELRGDLQKASDDNAPIGAYLPRIREAWEAFGATLEVAEIVTGVRQ